MEDAVCVFLLFFFGSYFLAHATMTSPIATSSVTDDINGFNELVSAHGITTVIIGAYTYALVVWFTRCNQNLPKNRCRLVNEKN